MCVHTEREKEERRKTFCTWTDRKGREEIDWQNYVGVFIFQWIRRVCNTSNTKILSKPLCGFLMENNRQDSFPYGKLRDSSLYLSISYRLSNCVLLLRSFSFKMTFPQLKRILRWYWIPFTFPPPLYCKELNFKIREFIPIRETNEDSNPWGYQECIWGVCEDIKI